MTSLMTSLVSYIDADYIYLYLYRLIQVLCHKYSFVFFYIIVIRLDAWLIDWL